MNVLPKAHFTDIPLINATNPVTVNLIGAGGTGSKVLTGLMEMNHSLLALGHPGLFVRLWDDDRVTGANIGRQRFAACETGLYKSAALINRANRWAGTGWKAETGRFERDRFGRLPEHAAASLTISCVDTAAARFEVAGILGELQSVRQPYSDRPRYWLDFGNGQHTGQVILATAGEVRQPESGQYTAVGSLPFVTAEFGGLLEEGDKNNNTPSCSVAEALGKQDLYINSTLAQMGCSLLWDMLRNGMTLYRGFFLNLGTYAVNPLKVA